MMKKICLFLLLLITMLSLSGCKNKNALKFKEEYESINGQTNSAGKEHRIVNIKEDNPYQKVSAKEIIKLVNDKETFYVYFGDKLCPWCRSVIEKSIEVANKNNIKKIYYVAIWDDEGKEILRDKYSLEEGKLVKTIEGTDDYQKLLEIFDDLLSDYSLTDDKGKKIDTGEKRIFAPNFIYVEKGVPIKLVDGISSLQTDSREKLTEEILKEEEEIFNNFFKNNK